MSAADTETWRAKDNRRQMQRVWLAFGALMLMASICVLSSARSLYEAALLAHDGRACTAKIVKTDSTIGTGSLTYTYEYSQAGRKYWGQFAKSKGSRNLVSNPIQIIVSASHPNISATNVDDCTKNGLGWFVFGVLIAGFAGAILFFARKC